MEAGESHQQTCPSSGGEGLQSRTGDSSPRRHSAQRYSDGEVFAGQRKRPESGQQTGNSRVGPGRTGRPYGDRTTVASKGSQDRCPEQRGRIHVVRSQQSKSRGNRTLAYSEGERAERKEQSEHY